MRHDFFGLIRLVCFVFFIILFVGLCTTETEPAQIPHEIKLTTTAPETPKNRNALICIETTNYPQNEK